MRRIFSSLAVAIAMVIASGVLLVPTATSAATVALPVVKGGFNQTPTIRFPTSAAPTTLQVTYLHRGSGPAVKAGDLLAANYLGQIWGGKVFDSSFSRKQLSSFLIGVGAVIPGWDKGLVGVPLGSEILLVIPPAEGYGTSGYAQAGITGKDTLVFVVDVVAQYGKNYLAQADPKVLHNSVNGITVKENGTKQPTISVAKGAARPTAVTFAELASGSGKKIVPGLVILQLVQFSWAGDAVDSTWTLGSPFGENVGLTSNPEIFDQLVGLHLGSRVLLRLPEESGKGPYVLVAEAVSEPQDSAT